VAATEFPQWGDEGGGGLKCGRGGVGGDDGWCEVRCYRGSFYR
jgi:hypothetical protein